MIRILLCAIFLQTLTAVGAVHGPICQWHQDPCSSMAVHWIESSAAAQERPFIVTYRKTGGAEWLNSKVETRPFGPTKHWVYSTDLSGLDPDSRYNFKISQGDRLIGSWFFKTAPKLFKEGMSFVTGGDMFHAREMLDGMNLRAGTENPLFALLGGDLAYANGVDGDRWLEWVESWSKCAITLEGCMIPMIPVIGNHEVKGAAYRPNDAPPRSEAPFFYSLFFGMKEGSKFTIDFEKYLTVVALDSGHTENIKPQTPWLRRALHERKAFPFKFICYHRPAWGTGVKNDAVEIQRAWCPLFEEFGVDAVFENDHHTYKRTHPLKGGKRDNENGVVYLGDGAWGTRTRAIGSDIEKQRPFLAKAASTNHLIKVILKGSTIRYEAITAAGVRFDIAEKAPRSPRGQ